MFIKFNSVIALYLSCGLNENLEAVASFSHHQLMLEYLESRGII